MSLDDTSPCPLCGDTKLRSEALRIQGALDSLGIIKRTCAEDLDGRYNLYILVDKTIERLIVSGSLISNLLWQCQIKHIDTGKGKGNVPAEQRLQRLIKLIAERAKADCDKGKDQDSSGSEGDAFPCSEAWIDKCNGKGKGITFFDSHALRESVKPTYIPRLLEHIPLMDRVD
jgi:hypothetical protein